MKITLYWVGKTKESFIAKGIEKYLKLLKSYATISVVEIKEEKGRLPVHVIKEREGRRLLDTVHNFIVLDEHASEYSSHEFADFINKNSHSHLKFVIGGAFGISYEVQKKACSGISLSRLTFTHEMARLIFLEQLYRAFTIIRNKTYHY
jgi:23S rRNA (pseudouridine1915-N3)-methyltransferase